MSARTKTLSRFAETAKYVYCAIRTTDIRVTENHVITICLVSHFGAKACVRGQRKWSVTFSRMQRRPNWLAGPTFEGIGLPIKFETDDFTEARHKFNELERKAYVETREILEKRK